MARKVQQRLPKKAIYVFWEGESEEAYTKALKRMFSAQAAIKPHREKGTFETARTFYRGNKAFQNAIPEYDELWFFFDTEIDKADQWERNMSCLKEIVNARKRDPILIRLLMTTGCVEYWFQLHYERVRPAIVSPADKGRVLNALQRHVPAYAKGDQVSTEAIALRYKKAVENGRWTLDCLKREGMPEERAQRDQWLYQGKYTFTTVHEAVEMLMSLAGDKSVECR